MSVRPLTSRVAIVTGANQGIGAATAVALAAAGADVGVSYLRLQVPDDDPGRPAAYAEARARNGSAVVRAIEAAGRRAVPVEADLSDPSTPRRIFDRVEAALGPVSILVNNASGWRQDTFGGEPTDGVGRPNRAVTAASIDAQLLVDARGSALMISELATRARRRNADWGRIVSLTSGGPGGFPGEVSYGAAKAALESFTMSAASELAAAGITANVVHPPVTDTGWVTDAVRRLVAESHDLHHVAEPGDVAEVVVWLCTDAARLVTGTLIRLR
ncbi:MAG: SDR family NAD(P)-dependent oxidoreductase [Acidimicrobiales bacterium]